MFLTICLSFIGTSLLYLLVAGLVCWRITGHLRGNTPATTAVVEHVLMPLFGRQPTPAAQVPYHAAESLHNSEVVLRQ